MVTIVDFVKRQNREGKEFNALILQSGIELVKAKETGSYYATSKRASISSTFDDATCQNLIGQQIPGSIQKVVSEPYKLIFCSTFLVYYPIKNGAGKHR